MHPRCKEIICRRGCRLYQAEIEFLHKSIAYTDRLLYIEGALYCTMSVNIKAINNLILPLS